MQLLYEIIRKEFIEIYCSNDFLKSLHTNLLKDIKLYNFKIVKEGQQKFVEIIKSNKVYLLEIPRPITRGKLTPANILKSKYMIN